MSRDAALGLGTCWGWKICHQTGKPSSSQRVSSVTRVKEGGWSTLGFLRCQQHPESLCDDKPVIQLRQSHLSHRAPARQLRGAASSHISVRLPRLFADTGCPARNPKGAGRQRRSSQGTVSSGWPCAPHRQGQPVTGNKSDSRSQQQRQHPHLLHADRGHRRLSTEAGLQVAEDLLDTLWK